MDLGLLLFGVVGLIYGLTDKPKTKTETPKLPDCPQGCHYEVIMVGKEGYPVPIVVPNQ